MRFDAVITLIAVTHAADSIGQQIPTKVEREVYANTFSLSATEFYAAGAQGLKADCQYQVRSCEYDGEELMSVEGDEYTIVRVVPRGEWTLLTGEKVNANG